MLSRLVAFKPVPSLDWSSVLELDELLLMGVFLSDFKLFVGN